MALSAQDTVTYTKYLAEARDALHQLRIGRQVVRLKHGLKDTMWSPSTASDLMSYIASLEALLGLAPTLGGRQRAVRLRVG